MSRGGRGRGRGGGGRGKQGPDTDWDSDPEEKKRWLPTRTFPTTHQVLPEALSPSERSRVTHYRTFREALRDGPLYTVLEPSSLTDDTGKVHKRAGFDPFEGVPTWSEIRYKKPKRSLPDLSARPYELKYFPKELWLTIDPKRKAPEWRTLDSHNSKTAANTGPNTVAGPSDTSQGERAYDSDIDGEDEEEEDIVAAGRKKRRKQQRDDPTNATEKKGLEAEDELDDPRPDQNEDEDGEENEIEDTDYEENDDDGEDDYYTNRYFSPGDNDDVDDGGGDHDDAVM